MRKNLKSKFRLMSSPARIAKRIGLAAFLCLAVPLLSAWTAKETVLLQMHGGAGDYENRQLCPDREYLVGFDGRLGAWIDRLEIVCAPLLPGGAVGKHHKMDSSFGGWGGAAVDRVVCPTGIVRGIAYRIHEGRFLFLVQSYCRDVENGKNVGSVTFMPARGSVSEPNSVDNSCAPGWAGVGLQGRWGQHVNAIGLLCAPITIPESPAKSAGVERCPDGQTRVDGVCKPLGVIPGSTTNGTGFIQMLPTCETGATYSIAEGKCVATGGGAPQPLAPSAGGGVQSVASTCGLSGPATVVIPDPALTVLNVRDKPKGTILTTIPENAQVNVTGGCKTEFPVGIAAQPEQGWCAISSPVPGCVSEQFLVAGTQVGVAPAPGIVASQTQRGMVASFTGRWSAEAQGYAYTFNLNQNGTAVTGNYVGTDGSSGQLSGSVSGNIMRFTWQQQDGLNGTGKFTLSGDGNSFAGSYSLTSNPDAVDGSWNGTRN